MSDGAQTNPSLDRSEHIDENISAKRIAGYVWDGSNWQRQAPLSAGLVTSGFDYVSRTLTNSTTETYVFKTGGSGGTTVVTVVVVYTDSTLATISTVTKT